jgi:hypothetical protein
VGQELLDKEMLEVVEQELMVMVRVEVEVLVVQEVVERQLLVAVEEVAFKFQQHLEIH